MLAGPAAEHHGHTLLARLLADWTGSSGCEPQPTYGGRMSGDTPSRQTALSPATVVVHAGRPPHEIDQPLSAPITMASTYVAGGDLEYGRYANPTWHAFEEALGALEGGRALAFSSGLAACADRARPRRPGRRGRRTAARLPRQHRPAGRPRGPRPPQGQPGRHLRHRRGDRGARRRRASSGSSRRPTRPSRSPTSNGSSPPATMPEPASSSTTPSPRLCCRSRWSWAPTSCCTRRPSSSPGTATW